MPNSVYWDACLFIDVLQKKHQDRVDACLSLVARARHNEFTIITSALSIAEANKLQHLGETIGALPEAQSKLILDFFENPFIHVRTLDRQVAELAHQFTRTHALMPNDAIHAATAIINRVDVLYTYDNHKGRKRGLLRHNGAIGVPPLRIEIPPDPSAGTLWDPNHKPDT